MSTQRELKAAIDAHQTASDLEDPRSPRYQGSQDPPSYEDCRRALRVLQAFFDSTPRVAADHPRAKPQIMDPDAPASEKQKAFMQKIAGVLNINFEKDPGSMSKGEAGAWIDAHIEKYNDIQAARRGSVL